MTLQGPSETMKTVSAAFFVVRWKGMGGMLPLREHGTGIGNIELEKMFRLGG
jgi:hypothetical protein